MELKPIHKCVVGLDVHQAQITACALITQPDDTIEIQRQQFGAYERDRRQLAAWVSSLKPDEVVMESTGVYWKSPYLALEQVGINAKVVNARHAKNVPRRKTDMADAQWLATLARVGLLRGSFVPPANLRELRQISRRRQGLVSQLSAEKNRLHKVLTDGGIRLSVALSDLNGQSGRAMVKAIIAGKTVPEILKHASKRLRASREELWAAVQGELTKSHLVVLEDVMAHIEYLEASIARFDAQMVAGLDQPEARQLVNLLQTIPGVDKMGAVMLLIEIGMDMTVFGSADRLSSWVGVCPGNNESAGKRKSGQVRKGNLYVRRLLCEFAQAACRTRSMFKPRFEALRLRRGHKRAIVAIAHQLLRIIFIMLKRRTHYRDRTVDYEAMSVARNAPRWMQALAKFGYINPATKA